MDGTKNLKGKVKGVGLVLPGAEEAEAAAGKEDVGAKVVASLTTALNPDAGVDPNVTGLQKSGRAIGLLEDEMDPITVRSSLIFDSV